MREVIKLSEYLATIPIVEGKRSTQEAIKKVENDYDVVRIYQCSGDTFIVVEKPVVEKTVEIKRGKK